MRQHYDKLVRDRIPEIIRAAGGSCAVEVMEDDAFRAALRQKVIEEAHEAAAASEADLPAELADLFEVISALSEAYGLDAAALTSLQATRRAERGAFAARLRLLWSESPPS